jgi:starvation-inducible DNA-binding protein
MKPNLGIPDKDRAAVARLLQALLADLHVLYVKTRNYHWNVTGPHFSDYHKLFEGQYDALALEIDEVAERIRSLGASVEATMADFLRAARLKERPGHHHDAKAMLGELVSDHESLVRTLRADLEAAQARHGDAGTADFLTGLMEDHEKTAWMLRATLVE